MTDSLRHNWTQTQAKALYQRPFMDIVMEAQRVHRQHFQANSIQLSTLLNVKTNRCPEDCAYCSQSIHYKTPLTTEPLFDCERVLNAAKKAKACGATRFCIGAAWRAPNHRELDHIIDMIKGINALGLESCATLGMLKSGQAQRLKEAGLNYYNHNLDTSRAHYPNIVTTRRYEDRLNTLKEVQKAGIHVCCGGILGMGESIDDRLALLVTLNQLNPHPKSVPLNLLTPIKGTPLEKAPAVNPLDFVRLVAVARIMLPSSFIRLSSGRTSMSQETQALCFLAGANSIHFGEKLLTSKNADPEEDLALLRQLGITPLVCEEPEDA